MSQTPLTEDLDLAAVRTREDLAELLRILHARADSPSLRELGTWSIANGKPPLAKTTVSEMLSGKRLPRKSTLLTFVEACGIPPAQLEPWQRAWERIAPADVARPTLQAELRKLRQDAADEARLRANEIITRAQARAAQMMSEAADQGRDQDMKRRMVQVWVAEERIKQALADAEQKAQAIILAALEEATAARVESEERLKKEQEELGRIKVEVVEQTVKLRAIKEAIAENLEISQASARVENLGQSPENNTDDPLAEARDWQVNPELRSVRDAYDAIRSMLRIDEERQIRPQDEPEQEAE